MDSYEIIEQIYCNKYNAYRASNKNRKSIADFWLNDKHAVNIKSNNVKKNNYSPNIISASRIEKWLNDGNDMSFIFVDYYIINNTIKIIKETPLIPIEHISWNCLSIQAQGKGVIQKYKPLEIQKQSKTDWLKYLAKEYLNFIEKEFCKLCELEHKYVFLLKWNECK